MSLILSGPKRIYVVLLFWERLADPCATCPLSLVRVGQAWGVDQPPRDHHGCKPLCRVIMGWRIARILWRRLIGVSLLVLDPQP
jgi:hypothetical protein